MTITIDTLFNDKDVVSAVINRINQTRKDTVYWKQYLDFRRTTTRVFKDYIGSVQGVMAGSINSRYGEKQVRERKNIGYGYGEIAYLGDAYQMSIDRMSDLQDLIDKFNAAKPSDQSAVLNEIITFIADDYRQIMLAAHKRMDIVVGSLLMTASAKVINKDGNAGGTEMLDISLPFKVITPEATVKNAFISYLQEQMALLAPDYGSFSKMIMSRATFIKSVVGCTEFDTKFKYTFGGNKEYSLATGTITSQMASEVFVGLRLPAIDIKSDYVKDQNGKNVQIYADNRVTLLPQDKIGYMRFHTPYEAVDKVPGRNYTQTGEGDMLVSGYRDKEGRYLEYTAEWIPQISAPQEIVNFDLSTMNA